MNRTTITKDESNILVAIGKLETKFDGMVDELSAVRGEVSEIKNGYASRLLQLESNVVHKLQFDQLEDRVEEIERTVIAYRTALKVWIIVGGGGWSVFLILVSVLAAKYFGA